MAKTAPDDPMAARSDRRTAPSSGRPIILESAPPGLWATVIGAVIALLAPMFGFLVGTAMGPGSGGTGLSPIHLGLFLGVVVGGGGVLLAVAGGRRLYRRGARSSSGSGEARD